jgi:signal transduction histidine kinase/CHASE1-domain containing sensor protein
MKTELQERADILANNLQRSVDACLEVLRSISQFYGSSDYVSRQDFQRFVQPALARHPSIHALEWLPHVLEGDRVTFEQSLQAEGCPTFHITERRPDGKIVPAESRPHYFPVCYVEPLENNKLALGFDLASDSTRRAALERARDTGAIAISGRIELVQETQRQFGFLVILPIYSQDAPCDTVASRRQHLQGFVLGVFQLADVVRSSLSGLSLDHIDFHLHDRSDHPDVGLLARYESASKQVMASPPGEHGVERRSLEPDRETGKRGDGDMGRSRLRVSLAPRPAPRGKAICTRSFTIADRQWSLVLEPTAAYVDRAELYQQSQIRADAATAEAKKLKQALHNLQQTQARWFLEKNLIAIGVVLVLLILGGANVVSYRSLAQLLESKNGIERTYTILANLAKVLSLTTDAQSAEATASTPPPSVLSPSQLLQPELAALRQATSNNLEQQQRLDRLEPLIAQRLTMLQSAALPATTNNSDRRLQQQIRQLVAEIEQEERSHLPQWEAQAAASVRTTFLINIIGISLSFTLLVGVYYLLQRQISERQQVEAALYEANSQLELEVQERLAELAQTKEISDLKMRLFSMVSHEFRTPLSTILVSTQMLTNSEQVWVDEKKVKNLTRIQSAAKTMAQLLSDILTLGRAEAGKLEFRPETIDLAPFCHHLIDELQDSMECGQRINLNIQRPTTIASVDSKLLQSILTNLLSNAIKYSPADSPVQFTLAETSEAIVFHIQDYGIGIAPDDQLQLYDAFHRGKNVGDVVGTGLGLAVVKTCVDLHGGQITVDSEVNSGTTFTVLLPQ